MTARTWSVLLGLVIVLTLARVATTHRVFSQTQDEPWHLIGGYDLLTKGIYTTDLHHPPLARVFFAIPFLDTPDPVAADSRARGDALLLRNERYTQNLARARAGNLLFLALGILGVAAWARHLFSPAVGLLAAVLYASLPPVLAHAGLATTDMAVTAMVPLALHALDLLLERPTAWRMCALGLAIAAGLLSKYSFLIYFPACAVVVIVIRRKLPLARIAGALLIAFVLLWAAYGFTFSSIQDADARAAVMSEQIFGSSWMATAVPVPAPLFLAGALEVKHQDVLGHAGFLFGEVRERGWWYYFPVALFFKTPIPFLILALIGCLLLLAQRRSIHIVLVALMIVGVGMTSAINIGVRHVLPIYAPLSIAAAAAVMELRRFRAIAFVLVAWLVVGSALAHPDYLPWFNGFAGKDPQRILADSNFDWGQDVLRLVRVVRREHLRPITTSLSGSAPIDHIGIESRVELQAMRPVHGWLAISESHVAFARRHSPEMRKWIDELLEGKPYRRVGKTIRLYHIR